DEAADLLEGAGAVLAVGEDGAAGPAVGDRRRVEDPLVAGRETTLRSGDLDDTGPVRGPADERPDVVALVDPVFDVGDEEFGDLLGVVGPAPVAILVVALVVEPGRGDDVDLCSAADLGEETDVAAGVA